MNDSMVISCRNWLFFAWCGTTKILNTMPSFLCNWWLNYEFLCDCWYGKRPILLPCVNGGHHAVCCSLAVMKKNNNLLNYRLLVAGLWVNPLKTSVHFFQTTWCTTHKTAFFVLTDVWISSHFTPKPSSIITG
jgi:hypothetical protein